MIFTAGKEELSAAVGRAAAGLPSHPGRSVYAGLLLEAESNSLRITASDSETTFISAVKGEGGGGSHIIPGRLLADICRYFPADEVRLETEGSQLQVSSGRSRFTLPAAPGDQYPQWADPPQPLLQLPGEDLGAAIRAVSPAAGDDPVVLTAICTEFEDDTLKLVTTDHSRMALAQVKATAVPLSTGISVVSVPAALLPGRAAGTFARNCTGDASLGWDDALMMMSCEGLTVIVRQIGGKYLPWRKVLAKQPPYTCSLPVAELTRAVRMAQLASGPDNRISATFGPLEITVAAGREGRQCTEYAPCTYAGEPVTFLLGAQSLLDGLSGCPEDEAEVAFTEPSAALFLRSGWWSYMMQPRREL